MSKLVPLTMPLLISQCLDRATGLWRSFRSAAMYGNEAWRKLKLDELAGTPMSTQEFASLSRVLVPNGTISLVLQREPPVELFGPATHTTKVTYGCDYLFKDFLSTREWSDDLIKATSDDPGDSNLFVYLYDTVLFADIEEKFENGEDEENFANVFPTFITHCGGCGPEIVLVDENGVLQ